MVNTANAEGRVYRAERSHGKKNRRKFSSIMAMVLGAIVTIEIMIMGAMVLKLDQLIKCRRAYRLCAPG